VISEADEEPPANGKRPCPWGVDTEEDLVPAPKKNKVENPNETKEEKTKENKEENTNENKEEKPNEKKKEKRKWIDWSKQASVIEWLINNKSGLPLASEYIEMAEHSGDVTAKQIKTFIENYRSIRIGGKKRYLAIRRLVAMERERRNSLDFVYNIQNSFTTN